MKIPAELTLRESEVMKIKDGTETGVGYVAATISSIHNLLIQS